MWRTVSDVMPVLRSQFWLVALAGLLLASADCSQAAGLTPAEAKSAYLRYIAVYATWPGEPAADDHQPIVIGVVGDDPNGVITPIRNRLESGRELLARKRPIRLLDVRLTSGEGVDLAALASCDLIFLSEGAEEDWERIQPAVNALPILTVGEIKGFAESGGMIEYFSPRRSGKVRLKINLQTMRRAGIMLSAQLLALDVVIVLDEREEV
jgi:hypothetical protein